MRPDRTYNSSSWTKEEVRAFENILAFYYGDSNVFQNIAAAVPQKSTQEILDHFNVLLEDINNIESGLVPLPKYRRKQRSTVAQRKGIPWTAEEHWLFLQGLAKHGKGDWRGISRNFVLSRTPTQVASHAQKFFRRLKDNDNGSRRRSIHDITSAADITEPSSHGQESDELKGPCGGQSSVNPEKFPLGAALGSELNSSFPSVDEFLESIKDQITAPAEGPSGVYHGVDTRTSRSLSLQPSVPGGTGMYTHPFSFPDVDEFQPDVDDRITVPAKGTSRRVETRTFASHSLQPSVAAGGTGMYCHPVINVRYDLEELMSGSSQVGPSVNDASLPLPSADHIGVDSCTASSSGTKNGALEGVFPSVPVSRGVETYPCWYPSSKDENMFDLDDQFPHHIFGFGKLESVGKS